MVCVICEDGGGSERVCVCVCVFTSVCVCVCVCVCSHVMCMLMYVCLCVCIVYMFVFKCVCVQNKVCYGKSHASHTQFFLIKKMNSSGSVFVIIPQLDP